MDCLANIKFLDALDQPIEGLVHQLWVGSLLISHYVTPSSGESVWFKRSIGTKIDIRVRSSISGEYHSKVEIQLVGEKTTFIVRSPKVLLKGVNLSAKDVATGSYVRSTYIVAEGDYLSRIADDNHTTTEELIRINSLSSDVDIHPGQILKIPVKKQETSAPPPESKPRPQEPKLTHQEKTKIIVVQQTDTLPLITKLTANSVDEIKKLSGLSSDRLSSNQKLRVYDRAVTPTTTVPKPEKKEEKKAVILPTIKQQASKNKEKTPVAKVVSPKAVSSKNSTRNEIAISKLHPQVKSKVRNFINDVYKTYQIQLVIVQDYRSYAKQNEIYAEGRTKPGKIRTKAKGGESNHNFALAVDVLPVWDDGELHSTGKGADTKNINILKKIASLGKKNGLAWGGDWKSIYDPMHFELNTGLSMSQLRQAVANVGGDPLKVKYIEK